MEATAKQQTEAIQAWLEERLIGPWFGGTSFGWADVCAAPIVNRSAIYGNGPAEGSKLHGWLSRVSERDSVKQTFNEYYAGVDGMKNPAVKEAYLSGQRKREYRDHRLEWMVKSGALEVVTKGLDKDNIRFTWP